MEKDLINQIVSKLYEMTKLDQIIWQLEKNSKSHYTYQYKTEDGQTKFKIELSIDENLNLYTHDMWWLYIYNKNLSDGNVGVYSGKNQLVTLIVKELYSKYTKPIITSKSQEKELNIILNSLDMQGIRDGKIEKILTDRGTL